MDGKLRKFLHLGVALLVAASLVRAQVQQSVTNSNAGSAAPSISFTSRKATHSNASSGNTSAATITSQVSGDTNIVGVVWCDDAACDAHQCTSDTLGVADFAMNSYSGPDVSVIGSIGQYTCLAVFHAQGIATSASNLVTVTITSTNTIYYAAISVSEFAGIASNPTDQTGTTNAAGSSPISIMAGGNTAQASELVYALAYVQSATLSAGSLYNGLNTMDTNAMDEYQIVSSIATYTATFTYTGSSSTKTGVLVTYK